MMQLSAIELQLIFRFRNEQLTQLVLSIFIWLASFAASFIFSSHRVSFNEGHSPLRNSRVGRSSSVFDFQTSRHIAENYRKAEVPFIVNNDISMIRTVERWNHPEYTNQLLGKVKHWTEYSQNNHFKHLCICTLYNMYYASLVFVCIILLFIYFRLEPLFV